MTVDRRQTFRSTLFLTAPPRSWGYAPLRDTPNTGRTLLKEDPLSKLGSWVGPGSRRSCTGLDLLPAPDRACGSQALSVNMAFLCPDGSPLGRLRSEKGPRARLIKISNGTCKKTQLMHYVSSINVCYLVTFLFVGHSLLKKR